LYFTVASAVGLPGLIITDMKIFASEK